MFKIDVNCDMGEGFGVYSLGFDEEVIPYVSSINVACGFHASDPENIWKTVRLAKKFGVAVGAHPSYPDLVGFGRRHMAVSPEQVKADVIYQVGAVAAFCRAEGMALQHVKAHGALYNAAEKDIAVALAVAEAVKAVNPGLIMVCLAGSAMVEAAVKTGIKYVEEAFADRAYTSGGALAPRSQAGAVITDVGTVASRVVSMVKDGGVMSIDGKWVNIKAQTVCVHGDTPGAAGMVKAVRLALEENSIGVSSFGDWV
ncbi:MAG: 5-oxoprolinase subunit PxpA [Bacillota bacterium]